MDDLNPYGFDAYVVEEINYEQEYQEFCGRGYHEQVPILKGRHSHTGRGFSVKINESILARLFEIAKAKYEYWSEVLGERDPR